MLTAGRRARGEGGWGGWAGGEWGGGVRGGGGGGGGGADYVTRSRRSRALTSVNVVPFNESADRRRRTSIGVNNLPRIVVSRAVVVARTLTSVQRRFVLCGRGARSTAPG